MVLRLEDGGAAAIVIPSLFEEQISRGRGKGPHLGGIPRRSGGYAFSSAASDYALPPTSTSSICCVIADVGVPVIAFVERDDRRRGGCIRPRVEQAGADALELNLYEIMIDHVGNRRHHSNRRLIDIVAVVKELVFDPGCGQTVTLLFIGAEPGVAARSALGPTGWCSSIGFTRRISIRGHARHDCHRCNCRTPRICSFGSMPGGDLLGRTATVAGRQRRCARASRCGAGHHRRADSVQVASTVLRHGPSRLTYLRTALEQWCASHQSPRRWRESENMPASRIMVAWRDSSAMSTCRCCSPGTPIICL